MSARLVIIGNGMVGQRLLDRLVAESHDFDITVLCEEPRAAYDRVQLTSFFSGKSVEDLSLVGPGFFDKHGIAIHFAEAATAIDRGAKTVTTSTGRTIAYDKLVFATGSAAFVPPIPGRERERCFVYRTIEDLEAIRAAASLGKCGVVIGGGVLGLEAATAW
jgi:nitrite reductase (NADH) large subunit